MQFIQLLLTELKREIANIKVYYIDVIAEQVLFILIFLFLSGFIHILTKGNYTISVLSAALIGFVTWRVADGCILELVHGTASDARVGVLEQIYLSSLALPLTILARCLAIFLYFSVRGIILTVVLMLILRAPIVLSPGLIFVFIITQVGVFGVALVIVGLHLVYKNVSSITLSISTLLLFLTGAVTPLDSSPTLHRITQILPLTAGVKILRELVVGDTSMIQVVSQPSFYILLITSTIYGLIGWGVLTWGFNQARDNGSLAHY